MATKKRILLLNYEFPPLGGGASPVSYDIAKGLSETGEFNIDVVTMGYKLLPAYEKLNDSFRIYRVKSLRSRKEICHPWEQLTYLLFGYFKCRSLLKRNYYDICHTHFIIPTGILSYILKKQFNLPFIVTAHGSDVIGYNSRFKMIYPFLVKVWKIILDNAKVVISPSDFLRNKIVKVYPRLDRKKIIIIPNGIDIEKFRPQSKRKIIFSSGRLLRSKGFQHLIKAVSDEDIKWEVHIAGDGPMMNELKQLAERSKTKIIFHGWLDNNGKEYKDLLEQASIFCLLSKYESFGMVLLEAMLAGCAVITSNSSGCVEIINGSGLVVPPENDRTIEETINLLVLDRNRISSLGDEGRQRAIKFYDREIIARQYSKYL